MKRVSDYFQAVPKKAVKKSAKDEIRSSEIKVTEPEKLKDSSSDAKEIGEWKQKWIDSLNAENKELLDLEITTMDDSWLEVLKSELTKPYFLELKRFLKARRGAGQKVFPPEQDVYSWTRLTPLKKVKVLVIGQDPYHNDGQAHGLAFSVRKPTPPPPSLKNMYKELKNCIPGFEIPNHGSLEKWAQQGVLMMNACLTVDAHKANSHAKKGWEQFTATAIKFALEKNPHVVVMAWGRPAQNRVQQVSPGKQHLVLKSVHPSPLSASNGWFGSKHFSQANEWLEAKQLAPIDWKL